MQPRRQEPRVALTPATPVMSLDTFRTALLKRRCALAKAKAVQMAEEAATKPPPAPDPDSPEAIAAAKAAAEHAARVAEVNSKNKAQVEAYKTALRAWEEETAAARAAERERLLKELTSRRAERAAEQAGVEEKLKGLQAQSMSLMQQLKVAQTTAPLTSPTARQASGNPVQQQAPDRPQQGGWGNRQTMGPPGGYSAGGGGRGTGRGRGGGFGGGYAGSGHMGSR